MRELRRRPLRRSSSSGTPVFRLHSAFLVPYRTLASCRRFGFLRRPLSQKRCSPIHRSAGQKTVLRAFDILSMLIVLDHALVLLLLLLPFAAQLL